MSKNRVLDTPAPSLEVLSQEGAMYRTRQIAEFFKAKRLQAGLSREETAREIGLESVTMLVDYEECRAPIPLDDIFALTNALNIAPEDVLALVADVTRHSFEESGR